MSIVSFFRIISQTFVSYPVCYTFDFPLQALYSRAPCTLEQKVNKQTKKKKFIICISLLSAVHCSHTNLCHIPTPAEKSAVSCAGNNINANFVFCFFFKKFIISFFSYILMNGVMFILMCFMCGKQTSACA